MGSDHRVSGERGGGGEASEEEVGVGESWGLVKVMTEEKSWAAAVGEWMRPILIILAWD